MSLIQTEADITRWWRTVRETLTVPGPQLSFVGIDERGVARPHLTTIDSLPPQPRSELIGELAQTLAEVHRRSVPRGMLALLWSRPGRGPIRAGEAQWLRLLTDELIMRRVPLWPVHYATDAYLRVLGAEDLAA